MDEAHDSIAAAIATATDRIAKLQDTFLALQSSRGGAALPVEWIDVEADLRDKEQNLRQRYEQLIARERDFEVKSRAIQDTIAKRDAEISAREAALRRREEDLEQQGKEIQPMDTDIVVDHHSPRKIILLSRPQKKESPLPSPVVGGDNDGNHGGDAGGGGDGGSAGGSIGITEKVAEVRVRPYLKSLCESMDGDGLRKYVIDHKKDMGALRVEMPSALQHSSDPARLVLDAVQGYYHHRVYDQHDQHELVGSGAAAVTPATRRACILLLEALSSVLGVDHPVVAPEVKFAVREVAQQWKSGMDFQDSGDGNSLDAQAFLQLLVAYGLGSEYDEEELCKLVLAVARRKQSPALSKALNLSHKIPEIVDRLVDDGKQIEALAFAHAFEMMDRLEPVPLLKAYLKDTRKNVHKPGSNNVNGIKAPVDPVTKELAAIKNVIKCIEDYQLESDYPSSPLHKRVLLLERTKSERKRTGGSVKGQSKRPRNGGYERNYFNSNINNNINNNNNNFNRQAEKAQVFNQVPYNLAYDTRIPAAFAAYAPAGLPNGRSRTPAGNYVYSVDGAIYSSPLYGTQSPAPYSGYQIAPPGLPPPPPPPTYQAAYMH